MVDPTGFWTFGLELEWPDIDRQVELPFGWKWSKTDYTVVNRDGTANDPTGRSDRRGGELNSPPFTDPRQARDDTRELVKMLHPGANYRSNTHVHVRIPQVTLRQLKTIAQYTRDHLPGLIDQLDPLEPLLEVADKDRPAATKRLRHSRKSRHHFTTDERHHQRMQATSIEEFLAAECPVSKDGRVQWHLSSREAVNFRSLRKHGTLEFRHFAGTRSPEEVEGAISWCRDWLTNALEDLPPGDPSSYTLPYQMPFDAALERGWKETTKQ